MNAYAYARATVSRNFKQNVYSTRVLMLITANNGPMYGGTVISLFFVHLNFS